MSESGPRYGRREHARALTVNALTTPLNLALFVVVLAVGIVVSAPLSLSLGLAAVVFAAAATRTLLDEEVADRVLERRRGERRDPAAVSLAEMAPEIRERVESVREREERIRRAVAASNMPYDELGAEVDTFVAEAERSARGAQLLHDGLVDMPVAEVEQRLAAVADDPARSDLAEALREQLEVARRIESQLAGYHAQMERLCVELDTVRAHLLSTSVTAESPSQRQLASDVRDLREEMSAVAAGVEKAYADAPI